MPVSLLFDPVMAFVSKVPVPAKEEREMPVAPEAKLIWLLIMVAELTGLALPIAKKDAGVLILNPETSF